MANTLRWDSGKGYDIHVLRGRVGEIKGPPSRPLDQAVQQSGSTTLTLIPHFLGAPAAHGVEVNLTNGVVTSKGHRNPPKPRFPNFSFLMTIREVIGGVGTNETIVRIHIHDSIQKIWLTPGTLSAHRGHPECRFTVLALFDDGVVGDITDWPQLKYKSSNVPALRVLNTGDPDPDLNPAPFGGLLMAMDAGTTVDVTVTLTLPSPVLTRTATAKVFTEGLWRTVGSAAKVEFVAGRVRPDPNVPFGSARDSVQSVVENSPNILFISEGFTSGQGEQDFRKAVVDVIVNTELRTKDYLEPFKVLADSINYWSVFVASREAGIGILGSQKLTGSAPNQTASPIPLPRAPGTTVPWTVQHMTHEAGLPAPSASAAADATAWAADRSVLYDNIPLSPQLDTTALADWNNLRQRTLLNEKDTAFGIAHYDRDRASGQDLTEEHLFLDVRRTGPVSLRNFLERLEFGLDPSDPNRGGYEIGKTWVNNVEGLGKDLGLVCFICQSGKRGGGWSIPGPADMPYFAACTGTSDTAATSAAQSGNGTDIVTPAIGTNFSAPLVASIVAHGCGHALGLGDEYGDIRQITGTTQPSMLDLNLAVANLVIRTNPAAPPPNLVDVTKIPWLWPRIRTAALVSQLVTPTAKTSVKPEKCDQAGNPSASGGFLLIRFRRDPPRAFAANADVRLRPWPVASSTSPDPIEAVRLAIKRVMTNQVVVSFTDPNAPQLIDTLFDVTKEYALISLNSAPLARTEPWSLIPFSSTSTLEAARSMLRDSRRHAFRRQVQSRTWRQRTWIPPSSRFPEACLLRRTSSVSTMAAARSIAACFGPRDAAGCAAGSTRPRRSAMSAAI